MKRFEVPWVARQRAAEIAHDDDADDAPRPVDPRDDVYDQMRHDDAHIDERARAQFRVR